MSRVRLSVRADTILSGQQASPGVQKAKRSQPATALHQDQFSPVDAAVACDLLLLLRRKLQYHALGVGLSRIQSGTWEVRLVRRVRIVLGLKGERAPVWINLASLALDRAVEEVAGVELHARFIGEQLQVATGLRVADFGG